MIMYCKLKEKGGSQLDGDRCWQTLAALCGRAVGSYYQSEFYKAWYK